MKQLSRQDRNGTRTSEELRRRYQFKDIDYTKEEIEKLKTQLTVDDHLSIVSTNPVQNKVITEALNNKVNKETGKGLSSNDFTDTLENKLNNIDANAQVNIIESISVNGTVQPINNKDVNLNIEATSVVPITSSDLNTKIGELIIGYGNECTNRPTGSQNGFLINLPHTGSPTLYNKQFWFNRMNNRAWTRSMENGVWTDWQSIEIISSSIEDNEGYVWYANGTLEQWGRVSITPTAANTVTSLNIIFPKAYDKVPDIDAIPQANTPNAITWSVGGGSTTDEAKQGMIVYMTRTNTSATLFKWRAKGFKKP